jgi:hypothetical protein
VPLDARRAYINSGRSNCPHCRPGMQANESAATEALLSGQL